MSQAQRAPGNEREGGSRVEREVTYVCVGDHQPDRDHPDQGDQQAHADDGGDLDGTRDDLVQRETGRREGGEGWTRVGEAKGVDSGREGRVPS